jgi:hypothetical protein
MNLTPKGPEDVEKQDQRNRTGLIPKKMWVPFEQGRLGVRGGEI